MLTFLVCFFERVLFAPLLQLNYEKCIYNFIPFLCVLLCSSGTDSYAGG